MAIINTDRILHGWPCYCCCGIFMIICLAWVINGALWMEEVTKYNVAPSLCTITHRETIKCSKGAFRIDDDKYHKRRYGTSRIHHYEATSNSCPGVTLHSEMELCREGWRYSRKEVGTTLTCYIQSCNSGNFIWDEQQNAKVAGLWRLCAGSIMMGLLFCVCSVVAYFLRDDEPSYIDDLSNEFIL